MAELFVVSGIAGWLGTLLVQEAIELRSVQEKVLKLKDDLEALQFYLQNAKAKEGFEAEANALRGKFRNISYDAEDVIDIYIYKVRGGLCVQKCFRILCNDPLTTYKSAKKISDIQKVIKRFKKNFTENNTANPFLQFPPSGEVPRDERYSDRRRSVNYSYDDDKNYIVGLDKEAEQLIKVLKGDGGHVNVNVLSIVGMGGSGKTTLARKLFNHSAVMEYFDCRAWVSISQKCNPEHVFSEILRKTSGPEETEFAQANATNLELEALADKLRMILEKKSYLVVLDDVWTEQNIRDILKALPTSYNTKSKIIITSRYQEIVNAPELNVYCYKSQPLSENDAWTLFSKIVSVPAVICHDFERLGREMLAKCGGLPLAVVALAGILRKKDTYAEWLRIQEDVQSKVMGAPNTHGSQYGSVKDILALSYKDLSSNLKLCFLYLGIGPMEDEISTGIVTRMWIAEGLVTAEGDTHPEEVAMQHFAELSHRFMIQVVRTDYKGDIRKFRLHDLLRDLGNSIAKEERFLELYPCNNSPGESSSGPIAVYPRRIVVHSSVDLPRKYKNLRALIVMMKPVSILSSAPTLEETIDWEIACIKFKLLRVLNLWRIKITSGALPQEVGKLFFLRYLSVRFTNITQLPESIGNLKNLLTLDYRDVVLQPGNNVLIRIPNVLTKLERLRHLFLPIDRPWSVEELELGKLCQLQTLWGIKQGQGNSNDWLSTEMLVSSVSMKKLKIVLSTGESLKAALSCPSLKCNALHTFHCEMRDGVELQDVETLGPLRQSHLLKLVMVGRIQIMDMSLVFPTTLVMLELKDSLLRSDIDPMAALGRLLKHLRFLRLINAFTGTCITCGPDTFPQLEKLYLADLENLEIWNIESGSFSCLKRLEIIECKKLRNFPEGLVFITTIQNFEFLKMPPEFGERAQALGMTRALKLPHKCEAILERCDFSVNISSVHKVHERLTSGVYLDNKRKRYWLVKQSGIYNNCFMVYAKDLCITGIDGSLYQEQEELLDRYIPKKKTVYAPDLDAPSASEGRFLEWYEIVERDGAVIKTIKVNPSVLSFEVLGRLNSEFLSPEVTYVICYVIKLDGVGHGWKMYVDCELTLPDGTTLNRAETLNEKPRDEWVLVLAGEFKTPPDVSGDVKFSFSAERLSFWNVGLTIKGVIIRPKL